MLTQQQQQQHPSSPFSPFPPFLGPQLMPRFAPPADLAMFPLAKLDPRLFRIPFPEEPKPQHSYIGLIAMAILRSEAKKLVLADIYQYILDNFPYFRHRGPGWRNSIRHNLSLNDCFIKAGRASNGKGHFWAVHPACMDDFQKGDFSRRKAQRKVRRYLGMNLEEEEEDTPPVSPPPAPAALHTSLKSYDTNVGISGKRARSPEDQFEEMDDDEFLESLAATNNGGSRGSTPNGKRRKQDILQHKDSSKASFFF